MLLKLFGAVFVMSASVLAGLYYGSFETYRTNDLHEMKKALAILKAEIAFSLTPLPEAFVNISQRTQKPISDIFGSFAGQISENRRLGVEAVWENCLHANVRGTYFNKEDIAAFISLGRTLGYLDIDMQTAGIMVTIGYIDDTVAALSETRAKNKKLFGSLGVLGGLLIVIILI